MELPREENRKELDRHHPQQQSPAETIGESYVQQWTKVAADG